MKKKLLVAVLLWLPFGIACSESCDGKCTMTCYAEVSTEIFRKEKPKSSADLAEGIMVTSIITVF